MLVWKIKENPIKFWQMFLSQKVDCIETLFLHSVCMKLQYLYIFLVNYSRVDRTLFQGLEGT